MDMNTRLKKKKMLKIYQNKIEIQKFELKEPSLQEIFIDKVGEQK